MNNQTQIMTLCASCAKIYYSMPDQRIRRADRTQHIKERCEICQTHLGYDYAVTEVQKKDRRAGK
ncbi:MAG: hypothetical protein LBQ48_06605 [Oscillospiraceae bacterium]|nr:hypothetical protein [Oscillospiraceae bacterium]